MSKIKALLLLLFSFNVSFSQNSIKLKGKIIGQDSTPIINASVFLKKVSDSLPVAFAISNSIGMFSISSQINFTGSYFIQVTHIQYNSYSEILEIKNGENDFFNFLVKLFPANKVLNPIIIKTEIPKIKYNRDTIEFNAEAFKTAEVLKVSDLLKNMNGFQVDNNGDISYNGQRVKKILIEGEDLSGNNYKIISQNLDAIVVDKVQVLKNYNDNRLLKEVSRSDEVALNLKLSAKYKNKISGSISAGSSLGKRYILDENLININPSFKTIFLSKFNNVSNPALTDADYYFNENTSNSLFNSDNSYIVQSSQIQIPNLNDKYTKDNNDKDASLLNSRKLSKNIKVRTIICFSDENKKWDSYYFNKTIILDTSWETKIVENRTQHLTKIFAQIGLDHDNKKNNIGLYSFKFSLQNGISNYSNISNLSVDDTLSERLKNNINSFYFSGLESFKLASKKVLSIEFNLSKENIIQNLNLQTGRLLDYFNLDSGYNINNQKTNSPFFKTNLKLKWTGITSKKLRFNYGFQTGRNTHITKNTIENQNRFDYTNNIVAQSMSTTYNETKLIMFSELSINYNTKNTLFLGGFTGIGFNSISNSSKQKNNSLIGKFVVENKHKISAFKSISIGYKYSNLFANILNYYPSEIISGGANFISGNSNLRPTNSSELTFAYQDINNYKTSQLLINTSFSTKSNEYTSGSFVTPYFYKSIITPTDKNYYGFASINYERYFSNIKCKPAIQSSINYAQYNYLLNDFLTNSKSLNIRNEFKVSSAFIGIFNCETSIVLSSFINEIKSQNKTSNTFSNHQISSYSKLRLSFSKKAYANILYSFYRLSQQKNISTLDSYFHYKINKRISFSVTGHNIFNIKDSYQKFVSPDGYSENSFKLVGRYFLTKVNVNF